MLKSVIVASVFTHAAAFVQPAAEPPAQSGVVAQAEIAAVPAGERNRWKGEIDVPGGALAFSIELVGTGDVTRGTMSIPAQGVKDAALRDCRVDGAAMNFTLGLPSMPQNSWAVFAATVNAESPGTATGVLKQMGGEFPISMTRLAENEAAVKPRPQDPVPPFAYTEREVTFANAADGITLSGTLTLPEAAKFGKGPYATALLITGSGAQNRDEELMGHRPFLVLADHLAKSGIAVLRVDDRGVGGSTAGKGAATTLDFVKDVAAGVTYLKTQPEVDPARIGLIGHSEGGLIAPMVAAGGPGGPDGPGGPGIAFIVMLAGTGVNGREILVEQMGAMLRAEGVGAEDVAAIQQAQQAALTALTDKPDAMGAALGEVVRLQAKVANRTVAAAEMDEAVKAARSQVDNPWMRAFLTLDPKVALRSVKCPVLVLNGGLDAQVVATQNVPAIVQALLEGGNHNVTVRVFPRLNHLFQTSTTGGLSEYAVIEETFAPVALQETSRWINGLFAPAN